MHQAGWMAEPDPTPDGFQSAIDGIWRALEEIARALDDERKH